MESPHDRTNREHGVQIAPTDAIRPSAPERSRLAPSPTGALHLGNARTFLINWAIARARGWELILRIEDLDTPRVKAGVAERMLDTLRWLGIDWDGAPIVQSEDRDRHASALRTLAGDGRTFACELTRSQIEASASAPHAGEHEQAFPANLRPAHAGRAYTFDGASRDSNHRFLVEPGGVSFDDAVHGPLTIDPSASVGDFVVWTKRGQAAYQLAVVVDDDAQGVTQVVRGDDLLDSTARQVLLARALGHEHTPTYTHLPLVVGPDGRRLAKRHGDTRVDRYRVAGVPRDAVVGLLASWSIPGMKRDALSPEAFCERFDLGTMPREQVVCEPDDDAWLLSCAS